VRGRALDLAQIVGRELDRRAAEVFFEAVQLGGFCIDLVWLGDRESNPD
jgi:hypothetical protein